jgi:prepilin-type N-terminal cleavage/methylation domain-containing protein
MPPPPQSGFSLIELSIVLVILGLLAGAILAGKSLIRASELRTLSTDFGRYQTAVYSFRDRYFSLPGDFTAATKVWSSCSNYTRNNCNGNGDGILNADNCGTGLALERYRSMQHLALAGLIEGGSLPLVDANCTANTNQEDAQVGLNVPALRLSGAGMLLATSNAGTLYLRAGATFSSLLQAGILKQEEAWNVDNKIDDGKASSGKLRGTTGHPVLNQNFCLNGSGDYDLSRADTHCLLSWYFN